MGYSIFDDTLVDMTWPEIENAIQQNSAILFPIGVIEEHGPHTSLAVDMYVSYMISRLIKRGLAEHRIPTLIAPPYYWGINTLTGCFPGSFSVRLETMQAVLRDSLESLKSWGVKSVFFINWHAEFHHNMAVLGAVKQIDSSGGFKAYSVLTDYESRGLKLTGKEDGLIVVKTPPPPSAPTQYLDLHAGSLETGLMLNYFPDQVKSDIVRSLEPTRFTIDDLKAIRNGGNEARRLISRGYFGDPSRFDLESSRKYLEGRARDFAAAIESLLKGS
jgi:creatinine amidohydrolase